LPPLEAFLAESLPKLSISGFGNLRNWPRSEAKLPKQMEVKSCRKFLTRICSVTSLQDLKEESTSQWNQWNQWSAKLRSEEELERAEAQANAMFAGDLAPSAQATLPRPYT